MEKLVGRLKEKEFSKQIRKALGISAIYTEESAWRYIAGKAQAGAQIDLLLGRIIV